MDKWRICSLVVTAVVIAAGLAGPAPAHPGSRMPPGDPPGKPTIAELKAKLAAVRQAMQTHSEQSFLDAVADLKKLGPTSRVQEMLAELYPDADAKDKLVLLHVLNKIGVEHAVKALPPIAADFAIARPKHPNDMSFAGFYVLEKFMRLAWMKLPAAKNLDLKQDVVAKGQNEPKPKPPDEHKPNKVSADGFTHTGSPADRKAIRQFVLEHKLHVSEKKNKVYAVPPADDPDWVRVVGRHAFVSLRGASSGVDYIFIQSKDGEWGYLADLGHWVN